MRPEKEERVFDHSGSRFDDFLEEEGIREEVEAIAAKRVLCWEFGQAMQQQRKTRQTMARELHTSRSQVDRLLDPNNASVSLLTIARAAKVLGKRVVISIEEYSRSGSQFATRTAKMGDLASERQSN
jgi:antitoxin HicB